MAKKFMDAIGNPIWIEPDAVAAVSSFYSDGSKRGDHPKAKLLVRVHLRSGATLELDSDADFVASQIFS